jgi:23S rRNA pseudouridine2605 synthase
MNQAVLEKSAHQILEIKILETPKTGLLGPKKNGPGPSRQRADKSASSQPDPMKTSVGYIGADSFSRQRKEQGPGGKSGGPRRNGGRSR